MGSEAGTRQSQRCLNCHHETIEARYSRLPHTMDDARLRQVSTATQARTELTAPRSKRDELACAACHREHHGASHDLSAISNQQCNTCHRRQFIRFADGHPEFTNWPYVIPSGISFDHRTHAAKHFAAQQREHFDCKSCHLTEAGRVVAVKSFDQACAACHQSGIERSLDEFVMLRLPRLNPRDFQREDLSIGRWPAEAIGEPDGVLPPLMFLLLLADQQVAASLEQFGPQFDFVDLEPRSFDDLEAAAEVAWAIKRLIGELSQDAPTAIRRRLRKSLGGDLSDAAVRALAADLPQEQISDLARRWFPELTSELPHRRSSDDQTKPQDDRPSRLRADGKLASGQWLRDDETCELIFKPTGHANGFVQAWMEVAARSNYPAMHEPGGLREQLLGPQARGQCVTCHQVHAVDNRAMTAATISWFAREPSPTSDRGFTKFDHGPHLFQPQLDNCQACHALNLDDTGEEFAASPDELSKAVTPDAQYDFLKMQKGQCASCHTPHGAGDSCLKCHRYHVRQDRH